MSVLGDSGSAGIGGAVRRDDGSWVVWFLWLYWEDNKLSCLTLCFAKGVGYMLGEGN